MTYILSTEQKMFAMVAEKRLATGLGTTLLLEGPPGGGKTSFAKHLAESLEAKLYFYSSNEFRNSDLTARIDVNGVVKKENAWVKGPCWQAFENAQLGQKSILLIDELDKAATEFDAILLRLLEEWSFEAPTGETILGDPTKVLVILTTNGRRKLRGELLRRCQRINFPFPGQGRLEQIVQSILKLDKGDGLTELLAKLGVAIFKASPEEAPSPKELALLYTDALSLAECQTDVCSDNEAAAVWQALGMSYLTKTEEMSFVKKACEKAGFRGFNWAKALRKEARSLLNG